MKLTQQQKAEICKAHDTYWNSYLSGDVSTMSDLLSDNYSQVGSAEDEVFDNKKLAVQFLHDTIDQVAGKMEMRNRITTLQQLDELVLVHERCDLFARSGENWFFYARFRASTIMKHQQDGWKIIHQHSSFPDAKTEEGQNVAIDKITAENDQLREAVKRRTIELEYKNRELEIETALERVRARTMAMRQQDELIDVITLLADQLVHLGVDLGVANFSNGLSDKDWDLWLYTSKAQPGKQTRRVFCPWIDHPYFHEVKAAIGNFKKGIDLSVAVFGKADKDSFLDYVFAHTTYKDDYADLPDSIREFLYNSPGYTWSSIILKDTWVSICRYDIKPFSDKQNAILRRFTNAFGQAYTRFLDLQKAEAQVREAQIENALEKVRSRSLAMHKSEELQDVVTAVFERLKELDIQMDAINLDVYPENLKDACLWTAIPGQVYSKELHIPYAEVKIFKDIYEGLIEGKVLHTAAYSRQQKNEFYEYIFSHSDFKSTPGERKKLILAADGCSISFAYAKNSGIMATRYSKKPFSEAENNILIRFARVFEQCYIRFKDLEKAETQSRESQIQLALERVRARTMAMQKSEELLETTFLLFEQFKALGETSDQISIGLFNEEENVMDLYTTMYGAQWKEPVKVDLDEPVAIRKIYAAWKNKKKSLIVDLSGNDLKRFNAFRKKLSNLDYKEKRWVIHAAFFSKGVFTFSMAEPPQPEIIQLLERFAGVFEQTYTRFLDLQKAEVQAREAQIEAALEKVRSRSLAMHKADELQEVVTLVLEKLQEFGIAMDVGGAIITTYIQGSKDVIHWLASPDMLFSTSYYIPYFDLSVFSDFWEAKESGKGFLAKAYSFEEKNAFFKYAFEHSDYKNFPDDFKNQILGFSTYAHSAAFSKNSAILIPSHKGEIITDKQSDILKRFAKVFEQSYIRFLDLQKAEAQAREAQIEAALEKVRSHSLAMHKSDELNEVLATVHEQLTYLKVEFDSCHILIFSDHNRDIEYWTIGTKNMLYSRFCFPYVDFSASKHISKAREDNLNLFAKNYHGSEKADLCHYLFEQSDFRKIPEERKQFITEREEFTISIGIGEHIGLQITSYYKKAFSTEENEILTRFTKVFEQAYIRFQDLQKAEAQAREAQIEAALEKVRSRSLAMHTSQELKDVVTVVLNKLQELGIVLNGGVGIATFNEGSKDLLHWISSPGLLDASLCFHLPYTNHPLITDFWDAKEKGLHFLAKTYLYDDLNSFWQYAFTHSDYKKLPEDLKSWLLQQQSWAISSAWVKNSAIYINNYSGIPFTESENEILVRFATVFEQTYIRFLDLQKAEAQAREAQIQLSLERVRSRAMAMHTSEELNDVLSVLFDQFDILGIQPVNTSLSLIDLDKNLLTLRITGKEGKRIIGKHEFALDTIDIWKQAAERWKTSAPDAVNLFEYPKEILPLIWNLFTDIYNSMPDDAKPAVEDFPDGLFITEGYCKFGYLGFAHSRKPTEEEKEIVLRFSTEFGRVYQRFLDLQKAEAQAMEATRQASIERVRGEIASMRYTNDLQRITPLIWKELKTLGVDFIRCGVFIIDEHEEKIKAYLSAADGLSLATIQFSFTISNITIAMVSAWRSNQVYKAHWTGEEFHNWTDTLIEEGQVPDRYAYEDTSVGIKGLEMHFIPFSQGMMYVGNTQLLSAEETALVTSLAEAFSIAYARYEDFTKLEKAKQHTESALTDLKATQAQLIQSEKMASLGELTAGIAHEIQNPLNFVNNFSEVNKELLEELADEIIKGNTDDISTIIKDLADNEEKINLHGKRADAIVKGMLQHSRTSKGERELTDINALCDEYLRLTYHGLRAKDKSFNASIKTDFDNSIGKISVVPQDIGRVIMNLLTNAFYACTERSRSAAPLPPPENIGINSGGFKDPSYKYEPTVWISTKKEGGKVLISVKDNGQGIPQNIVDKIFQPFFTTKPTGQGTGLGLSLSYDIIKAHGGEIKVETKEGEGTQFTIILSES